MKTVPKLIDFSGDCIFVGIDVHKKNWKVTFRYNGREMDTCSMPPSPSKLLAYLQSRYPNAEYRCVYEAGFCGFWIQRELVDLGAICDVIHPADVPTTHKERRRKTDSVDSRKLARSLEKGELTAIFVPDRELEDLRQILRRRVQLVKDRTRTKNRIKQFLHFHGIDDPEIQTKWSKKYLRWLETLTLQMMARITLDSHLSQLDALEKQIAQMDQQLKEMSRLPRFIEGYSLLISIPSIGPIAALTLLTELGDINRFKSLDELCSYAGLVPDTSSSGDREQNLGITKRGNSFIRRILIECGWIIIRKDPAMAKAYKEYCKRMTGKRAIIRITKKLLSRIRYVLKNRKKYKIGLN